MSPHQPHIDVHENHDGPASLTSDSSSSVGTASSPTLPVPESLLHDVPSSPGSPHGTPTVKFAPLPQIDPNRKRSLAPLGASARSRRKRAIQQEAGSLLWSTDPDLREEDMEDPIIVFAKFIKRTGKTLWRRVRQGSKGVVQANVSRSAEHILDISSAVHPDDMALWEKGQRVFEDERGTLCQDEVYE